jgi:hypothetical protein
MELAGLAISILKKVEWDTMRMMDYPTPAWLA